MAALRLQALNIHNVGRQWFKTCGAASKKETSATSYAQYLKTDELEELKDDVKQIAKDGEYMQQFYLPALESLNTMKLLRSHHVLSHL